MSKIGSDAVMVEPLARNAAVRSPISRPICTVFASIGMIAAPARSTAARLRARSMIELAQIVGTITLPELVDIERIRFPRLPCVPMTAWSVVADIPATIWARTTA